jgi:hypothetical protein
MKTKCILATAILCLAATTASGQVLIRDGQYGDKVTGDIFLASEADMFIDRVVEGSEITVRITPDKQSPYRASLLIYPPESDFISILGNVFLLRNDRGFKSLPILAPSTGRYRILVNAPTDQAGNPFGGSYRLKAKVKPPKRRAFIGAFPAGGGQAEVIFPALAGSVGMVNVKGGPGTPVPEIADLCDPGGNSILEGLEIKIRKKSVGIKNIPLELFGDYVLKLKGGGSGEYQAKVKIKYPKRKSIDINVSDGVAPEALPITLSTVLGEPLVVLSDEEGAGNDFLLVPVGFTIRSLILSGATPCEETNQVLEENRLISYDIVCEDDTYGAEVHSILYDEAGGPLTSLMADVRTPEGTGTITISNITRAANGRVAGYTEQRTFGDPEQGEEVRTYSFTVRNLKRQGNGQILGFWVDLSGPEGPIGSFPFPAWQLPEE